MPGLFFFHHRSLPMAHEPAPRVFLFDVLDTLVRDPFYQAVPAFFGMSLEELFTVKHPSAWVEFERGERTEEEYLRDFFRDRREVDGAGLRRVMVEHYDWLPGMESLLGELAGSPATLHAFSNYPVWYRWIEDKLKVV